MNMVERLFSILTIERIRRGIFKSVADLENAIVDWVNEHNDDPEPFKWTKSAKGTDGLMPHYTRTGHTSHQSAFGHQPQDRPEDRRPGSGA